MYILIIYLYYIFILLFIVHIINLIFFDSRDSIAKKSWVNDRELGCLEFIIRIFDVDADE